LGPILFVLCINDLPGSVHSAEMVLYVDDINVLVLDRDLKSLELKIKLVLKQIETWFSENELILNADKTRAMLFYFRHKVITYSNIVIPYSVSMKFVGINITGNLRWCEDVNNLCNNLNKAYFLVKCLKDVVSGDMIKTIYFTYFQSRMKCSIMFWVTDSCSKTFFYIQEKVIRLMYGIRRHETSRGVFKIHKILTMTSSYILEVLCFIKNSSEYVIHNSQLHNYNTRGKNDLHFSACIK
jgi:hypothetical protein